MRKALVLALLAAAACYGNIVQNAGFETGDFTGWTDHAKYMKAFERLMRDLKAESPDRAEAAPAR